MLAKRMIIAIFFITIINACKKDDTNNSIIIKLDPTTAKKEVRLTELVDSIKLIKLQTDSNCVMGRVRRIIIKDKYIYAIDVSQQIVFVFDHNGNFISKLDKRGKGPGEYYHLGFIFIDESEEFIEVLDLSKNTKILKYTNISFEFINSNPAPLVRANMCRRNGSIYYFATQQIENRINEASTNAGVLIVKNGKIAKKIFNKNITTNNSVYSPNIESFSRNDENQLFVSIMYDNIFYQLQGLNTYPVFTIDFGRYSIDNTIGQKSLEEQIRYLKKTNGLASFPVLNINNSKIMAFSYYFKQDIKSRLFNISDYRQYILLKKNNKIFHTKKIVNNISNFPDEIYFSSYFRPIAHDILFKGYLVDIIVPGYYFNNEKQNEYVDGVGEININDNPVIVLMKLKKELR